MLRRTLRLTCSAAVVFALAGCTQGPPAEATTATRAANAPLPDGLSKTKKGMKGKMDNNTRKAVGVMGLD